MAEGGVYLCGWKATGQGYLVWLEKRPALRCEAGTIEEATTLLADRICGELGDGEAVLEFDPPVPQKASTERFYRDDFVTVCPNSHFELRNAPAALFTGGVCRECGHAVGPRTETPISAVIESGVDAAFFYRLQLASFLLVSAEFLALLTKAERQQFEARPVQLPPKRRKRFFEIIPQFSVPPCGVAGLTASGWKCSTCGYRSLNHEEFGWSAVSGAVCRKDFPSPRPQSFFVGSPNEVWLCMPRRRWLGLRGKPGTRGLMTYPVPVVEPADCIREPRLPSYAEYEAATKRLLATNSRRPDEG